LGLVTHQKAELHKENATISLTDLPNEKQVKGYSRDQGKA